MRRDAGGLELVAQIFADLDVFLQELAILLLARVPARVPGPVDAQTQTGRIDLLTHYAFSFAALLAQRASCRGLLAADVSCAARFAFGLGFGLGRRLLFFFFALFLRPRW